MRCAIVGFGSVARDIYLNALDHLHIEIASVCDSNPSRIELAREIGSAMEFFSSVDDFLSAGVNVDFVVVCTPGFTHYDITRKLLMHSYNVFVEKPAALSLAEFDHLCALAIEKNAKLTVCHNYRVRPGVVQLKRDIEQRFLGRVEFANLLLTMESLFVHSEPWIWEERNKVFLYEFAIHHLDFLTYLFGEPKRVTLLEKKFDNALQHLTYLAAYVKFSSGVPASLTIAIFSSAQESRLDIYGVYRKGYLRLFTEGYTTFKNRINPISESIFHLRRSGHILSVLRERFIKPKLRRAAVTHRKLLADYQEYVLGTRDNPMSLESIRWTMVLLEELSKEIQTAVE